MIPDKQIWLDVMEELKWEPVTSPVSISVAVLGGIVSLSGNVKTYQQRHMAVAAAKRVKGVRSVVDDLSVQLEESQGFSDEEMEGAAAQLLAHHLAVPANRVQVKVAHAHLTLDGYLDCQYQKDAAYEAVRNLPGVREFSNFLFIKPGPGILIVVDKIRNAIRRRIKTDPEGIALHVAGSIVTLSGKVSSWAERETVEQAVWSSPGVAEVINALEVVS